MTIVNTARPVIPKARLTAGKAAAQTGALTNFNLQQETRGSKLELGQTVTKNGKVTCPPTPTLMVCGG